MKEISSYFLALFISFFSFSQNIESKIDAIVSKDYKKNEPGIAILVAKNAVPIYQKAIGSSNLKTKSPLSIESVFQIGSITKQFTAISILMLQEKGLLNIEDKASKYLPEYPDFNQSISIYHLLNHTSGIKNRTPVGDRNYTYKKNVSSKDLIDYFIKEPLDFNPGERFKYSNAGYILLGRIIENVSGKTYEKFVQKNIFQKLGMTSSYVGENDTKGYQIKNNEYVVSNTNLALAYSAGSISMTVNDMLKWQNALQSNILIRSSNYKKATEATKLNNGRKIPYGFGFRIARLNNSKIIAHGGSTKGFTSMAIYLPKENVFITALTNCNCKNVNSIVKQVAELFIPKTTENKKDNSKKKAITLSSDVLEKYVGDYEVRQGVIIKIGSKEKKSLYLLAPNQTKQIPLFAKTQNHFFMNVSNAEITFNMNTKGKVIGLTMHQSGRKIIAIRK